MADAPKATSNDASEKTPDPKALGEDQDSKAIPLPLEENDQNAQPI